MASVWGLRQREPPQRQVPVPPGSLHHRPVSFWPVMHAAFWQVLPQRPQVPAFRSFRRVRWTSPWEWSRACALVWPVWRLLPRWRQVPRGPLLARFRKPWPFRPRPASCGNGCGCVWVWVWPSYPLRRCPRRRSVQRRQSAQPQWHHPPRGWRMCCHRPAHHRSGKGFTETGAVHWYPFLFPGRQDAPGRGYCGREDFRRGDRPQSGLHPANP